MKKKYTIKNKHITYVLLIGILFFGFLGINSFGKRINEDSFLSNYNSKNRNFKNIPEKLKDEWLLLQISKSIKNKNFEIAHKYISGDISEDYFNKGTIKLLQAYGLAKQNNLSGLQQARTLILQANNDLEIAKNIQLDTRLNEYINKNIITAQGLSTIIETKTCYQEGGILLVEIGETLNKTNKILDEQTKQIEKLKSSNSGSGDACIVNLINIISNNKTQISNVKGDLLKKEQDYKNIIGEKLKSPAKCKGTSFEESINKTREAKESMIKYLLQQMEISQILDNPTPEGMNQLCNGSKNDSQLNENLSNSVSQMMKDLQKQSEKEKEKDKKGEPKDDQEKNNPEEKGKSEKDNTEKEQNNKKGEKGEKGDKQDEKGNGESEYKDVLEQQERNLLNQTQQNSNKLIQQIQQIKGQGNYNGYQYIKNLFNSFMGNEGDLKNLHETSKDGGESNGTNQTQRY